MHAWKSVYSIIYLYILNILQAKTLSNYYYKVLLPYVKQMKKLNPKLISINVFTMFIKVFLQCCVFHCDLVCCYLEIVWGLCLWVWDLSFVGHLLRVGVV